MTRHLLGVLLLASGCLAQNLVTGGFLARTAEPITLTQAQTEALLYLATPPLHPQPADELAQRLDEHVAAMLAGWPWKPLCLTLGISGQQTDFDHPEQVFWALSLAYPLLRPATQAAVKQRLTAELAVHPPFAAEGYDPRAGAARELFEIDAWRPTAPRPARDAFGVYVFAAYLAVPGLAEPAAQSLWPRALARLAPANATFDPRCTTYAADEAERLNGDLAGLWAAARHDPAYLPRLTQAAEWRANLDRINPRILESTDSTTKHLHAVKLARYLKLVPETAELLRRHTDGLAAARVAAFRQGRNGWWLAWGERMIGGENYLSPPEMAQTLFAGAARIEQASAEDLRAWVDLPWCPGDLYWIEKASLALARQ